VVLSGKAIAQRIKATLGITGLSLPRVHIDGVAWHLPVRSSHPPAAPAAEPAAPAGKGTAVQSPLPGVILDIKVAVGDQVKAGQTVAILEAMKMENNINAECDGVITAIKVSKGDNILEGSDIVIIG